MDVLELYRKQNPKSKALYDRALNLLPSGCTRNVLCYPPFPVYMAAGRGSRIWDVDGNERIDFNFNNTNLILGHNHPKVIEAAREQLERGTTLGAPTEVELELAEELLGRLGADKIRFTPSGTEANLQAIRLARSYTRREKIAKCEGAYHGSWDAVDISVAPPLSLAGPREAPYSVRQNEGIPEGVLKDTLVFPFNDSEAAETLVRRHRHELAAVIVEPVQRDTPPQPGFLETLREVTDLYGIPLIFDEVISLRLGPGGAQEVFGVKPDITTMGKIIGGGFPVGAYVMLENFAELLMVPKTDFPEIKSARLGFSGTFNAHPITMASGLAVMKELRPPIYEMLDRSGERMRIGLRKILDDEGIAAQVGGIGSFFHITWTKEKVYDYRTAATEERAIARLFSLELMNRGVYLQAHPNVSVATSSEDIELALEAMMQGIHEMKPFIRERAPNLLIR